MGNTERNRRWRRLRKKNAEERASSEWHDRMLREVGWYFHYIKPCPPFLANAHTHGLDERFNHPNLQIVFPLGMGRITDLFWAAFHRYIKNGQGLPVNDVVDGIANVPLLTRWAIESGREVIRLIISDPLFRYDEDEMDSEYAIQHYGATMERQVVLEW